MADLEISTSFLIDNTYFRGFYFGNIWPFVERITSRNNTEKGDTKC